MFMKGHRWQQDLESDWKPKGATGLVTFMSCSQQTGTLEAQAWTPTIVGSYDANMMLRNDLM